VMTAWHPSPAVMQPLHLALQSDKSPQHRNVAVAAVVLQKVQLLVQWCSAAVGHLKKREGELYTSDASYLYSRKLSKYKHSRFMQICTGCMQW
jgi:hypothetical protein